MLKKLCGFAFLATTASAMALAGPGGTKGKPDKGGGDDPGSGGAFVPAYLYSAVRPGSIVFGDSDFSSSRTVADLFSRALAVNSATGRILIERDDFITALKYEIDASGNVDVLAQEDWLQPSADGSVRGGACVALADTGHAAFSSTVGLFLRDPEGNQESIYMDVPACAYIRGTSTLVVADRDQTIGQVTFRAIEPDGTQSEIGVIPGGISGLDVARNGSDLRILVSWDDNNDRKIVEWSPGEDITQKNVIENGDSASYLCALGSDGWPTGAIYVAFGDRSSQWIERTNTRRSLFGSKGSKQPGAIDPAC